MIINLLIAGLLAIPMPEESDSLRITDIEEVVVAATPKENNRLRQQALSSSSFSQDKMCKLGVGGMKALSANVPNLFIPDYGSHLTTSIYIRGIGSRTGTPAVALYVDGVPQVSPASFDFNFSDVDRVDVLRGPQSTLYGRNSMGGVVRVFTKNPFQYQGTDLTIGGSATSDDSPHGQPRGGLGKVRFSLTHYHRVSEKFAWSVNFYGLNNSGYFRNAGRDDELIDSEDDCGGRLRFILKPTSTLSFDLTVNHEWLNQGGYPYEYLGTAGTPTTPEPATAVGQIAYNRRSGYRRNLTNVGLTANKLWNRVELTSVTGFQHLHDRMDLDQDFTTSDLYALMQRQNGNTLSEELILKRRQHSTNVLRSVLQENAYNWLFGAAVLHQWLDTDGPVTFHTDGLDWLNGLINSMANTHMPTVKAEGYKMNFSFDNQIQGTTLDFPGTYRTPTMNAALFHQSTLENLLGVDGLTLAAGLRVDYERLGLDYDARYGLDQSYGLSGRLTYEDGHVRDGMVLVPVGHYRVDDGLQGRLHDDYVKLLPKASLSWQLPVTSVVYDRSSVYATVSRGYRSGGYNIQMFSDLLQSRMQTRIMQNVTSVTLPVVYAQPAMPDVAKATVETILTSMSQDEPLDVSATTWYEPETSWNYEVGTHLNLFSSRLQADFAAFWMDTRDQQVSQMSSGGLGRVTVNGGKSRSMGAEAALHIYLTDDLELLTSYGFADARFRNGGDHNFVPFIPRHTLSAGVTQQWHMSAGSWVNALSIHANYRAAGRVYWTSDNTAYQNLAGTLNGRITARHLGGTPDKRQTMDLSVYANNILGTRYQTFCVDTMKRRFAQYSRPAEVGLELRYCF